MEKIILRFKGYEEEIIVESEPFYIEMETGSFFVIAPQWDDWMTGVRFDLQTRKAHVRISSSSLVITFWDKKEHIQEFQAWLVTANEKARHGYQTMR